MAGTSRARNNSLVESFLHWPLRVIARLRSFDARTCRAEAGHKYFGGSKFSHLPPLDVTPIVGVRVAGTFPARNILLVELFLS